MGELIFTFYYGGMLIIIGIFTKIMLSKVSRNEDES